MPKRKERLGKDQIMELQEFVQKNDYVIEVKRAQAILMLEENVNEKMLKNYTGIDKSYAYKFRKRYIKSGLVGIRTKKKRSRSLLSKTERNEVVTMLQSTSPRDYGHDSDFWTTTILGNEIERRYSVKYKSKTPLYLIFKEAKFTYHKPDKQYKNRDQEKIDEWVKTYNPIIKQYLQDKQTEVLVEDELILTTQTTFQKIWLPKGEFPKIDVSNKRARRCVYGFLNINTGVQQAFKTTHVNSEETIKCLEQVGKKYPDKKIVIVWDNASWHKSGKVKEFLNTTQYNFHLINFPPYAPENNPQEHVWKAARANVTHNKFIENIDNATDNFVQYLNNTIFKYEFFNLPEL